MPKFTQKWALITFLEPVADGTEFSWKDWPLHTTLADVFAVDWNDTNLTGRLAQLLSKQKPLETVAGEDTYFGPPESPVQVTLLQKSSELQNLHNDVVNLLKSAGAVFNTPQYTGEGYVPHSTVQKHARVYADDTVKIGSLTIVDMFPNGDGYQRKLVKTINF